MLFLYICIVGVHVPLHQDTTDIVKLNLPDHDFFIVHSLLIHTIIASAAALLYAVYVFHATIAPISHPLMLIGLTGVMLSVAGSAVSIYHASAGVVTAIEDSFVFAAMGEG